jgi:hypothetical protein
MESLISDIPAIDGKIDKHFFTVHNMIFYCMFQVPFYCFTKHTLYLAICLPVCYYMLVYPNILPTLSFIFAIVCFS